MKGKSDLKGEQMITVLWVRQGCPLETVRIRNELEEMERLVGGYPEELMPFDEDVALVCNEGEKYNEPKANRPVTSHDGRHQDIICGDFFLCRAPIGAEEYESLTPEQIKKYSDMFRIPENMVMTFAGWKVVPKHARKDEKVR